MRTKFKNRPLFLFGVVGAALFGIASSNGLALTVANGDFSDTNGLTAMTDVWYSGVPTGWTTTAPSTTGHEYSVRQIDGVSYANLDVLGNVKGGWYPLRQTIGILNTATNLTVSFKATSLNGNPYKLTSAIYNANASNDTPPPGGLFHARPGQWGHPGHVLGSGNSGRYRDLRCLLVGRRDV